MTSEEMSSEIIVCAARRAATRSLLHDFSNVMVGMCSMSENAMDEIAPGSPMRDDMEIIRDSALRARQIISRISVLNGSDDDFGPALVDLVNWFEGEADTIRSILPRGSVLKLPNESRTVLVNITSAFLRDYLVIFAACAKKVEPHRVNMEIGIREGDNGCEVAVTVSDIDDPNDTPPYSEVAIRTLDGIAKKLNSKSEFIQGAGSIRASLVLISDKAV